MGVNNLSRVVAWQCVAGHWTYDLLITSPTLYCYTARSPCSIFLPAGKIRHAGCELVNKWNIPRLLLWNMPRWHHHGSMGVLTGRKPIVMWALLRRTRRSQRSLWLRFTWWETHGRQSTACCSGFHWRPRRDRSCSSDLNATSTMKVCLLVSLCCSLECLFLCLRASSNPSTIRLDME